MAPTSRGGRHLRRRDTGLGDPGTTLLLAVALTIILSGCGSVSALLKSDEGLRPDLTAAGAPVVTSAVPAPAAPATEPVAGESEVTETVTSEPPVEPAADVETAVTLQSLAATGELTLGERTLPDLEPGSALAQKTEDTTEAVDEEYDPWESFNEKMFTFNRNVDRFVLKPIARGYMFIMPEPWQVMIGNGFDNIAFVPRFINNLLQGKWSGAGRELARFLINSTAGIGGLFDPAKDFWGIQKSREDFGQTLGVWGSGPGPYLVLPFLEPLTVRDGIGKAIDGLMDPLSYLLPFFPDRILMKLGDIINERALNYDLFQGFEESVIDMYSAVRHGYLERRKNLIRE